LAIKRKALREEDVGVAWCLRKLAGNLLAQKRPQEAEEFYRQQLPIWGKKRGLDSDGYLETVRALAGLLKSENKPVEVEALYREVLAAQRAALGNNSEAVATTLSSLAGHLQSQGKQAEAEKASREALDITLKLIDQDPASLPALLRQESQTLNALGEAPAAEKLFKDAINTGRLKLGETNLVFGELLHDYAGFLEQEGNLSAAAEYYLKSLPSRRARQDDGLAWTLRNLGGALNQIGRPQEAEGYLRESLALYHQLHQQDDINGTGWATACLGFSLWLQHKLPEAEQAYRDALAVYTKLGAVGSDGYAAVVRSLRDMLKAENKPAEVEKVYQEVLAAQRSALGDDSSTVALTLFGVANFLKSQNRPEEAAQRYRESLDIIFKPDWEKHLFKLSSWVVPELLEAGDKQQATNVCRAMLNSASTNAAWFNNASWNLATTENPSNRDPAMAVELAKRAVKINPQGDWNTVGVAYYRAGDFKQAIADLEKQVQLLHGRGTSFDFFFQAMAAHQVGNADDARRFYAHAIQWMNVHDPQNAELLRFRAEAESLLGSEVKAGAQNQFPAPPTAK
jgi:tetratricopeptide (TPR) repeat protein